MRAKFEAACILYLGDSTLYTNAYKSTNYGLKTLLYMRTAFLYMWTGNQLHAWPWAVPFEMNAKVEQGSNFVVNESTSSKL